MGFAVLTPYEKPLRALTVLALGHLVWREGLRKRSTLLTLALSLALMFSQEAVRTYNRTGPPPPGSSAANASASPPPAAAPLPSASAAGPSPAARPAEAPVAAGGGGRADPDLHHQDLDLDLDLDHDMLSTGSSACADGEDGEACSLASASSAASSASSASQHRRAAQAGTEPSVGAPAPARLYLRFSVDGVKCEGCAARLKAAVLQMPGVSRCAVEFGGPVGTQVLLWLGGGAGAGVGPHAEAGAETEAQAAARLSAAIQFLDLGYRVRLEESGSLGA
ncbi:hypothetical protein HYH03_017611 [Edaphochlamys debaryana]|uniref:HMA domain-containing protein n=1 Tax=Edaphochlamys debaryana TaxID=47281 RepID=A0A835XJN5_9CHLO|nr:hypothetical protein HYH03_017611 [Edaphochlamys debaryana]|eukprot:KAG2483501.1 hypothetical protein HYH03_017611 [Edaphochlamys debaryana]